MGCGSSALTARTTENKEEHKKKVEENAKSTTRIQPSVHNEVEPTIAKVGEGYTV